MSNQIALQTQVARAICAVSCLDALCRSHPKRCYAWPSCLRHATAAIGAVRCHDADVADRAEPAEADPGGLSRLRFDGWSTL